MTCLKSCTVIDRNHSRSPSEKFDEDNSNSSTAMSLVLLVRHGANGMCSWDSAVRAFTKSSGVLAVMPEEEHRSQARHHKHRDVAS